MGGIKSFDFFRKVPKDFTEGSTPGSILSVFATVIMVTLFFLELKSYMTVKIITDIIMDPSPMDRSDLPVTFSLTMPELVCQFASIDVSDMMGTERQGVTKDITMTQLDDKGNPIGVLDYNENDLVYEKADAEKEEHPCTVTLYEHADFTGWKASFEPGEYDHAKLEKKGAMNDDVESIVVEKGCSAVIAQNGEHDGWQAVLQDDGGENKDGRYTSKDLEAAGAVLNDVSSLVVHHGHHEEANTKHTKVKEARASGIPQRGQVDTLEWSNFDEYVKHRKDKMVVVDFYAPWCHWCKLLDPVWQATAEKLPDQSYAKDVRMAKVDCEANGQLCQEHNIRAYPTIQIYMHGQNKPSETYYGDRTTDAFFQWMEHEHKILEAEQLATKQVVEAKKIEQGPDFDPNAHVEPVRLHQKGHHGVEGCSMDGVLMVKRVPGNFHINFAHDNMDYKNSLINATHLVGHLTFGNVVPAPVMTKLEAINAREGGPGFNALRGQNFVSEHADRTYEHFIQIVPTIYKMRSVGEITVYRYTVTSAEHEDTERYPSAKFTFQFSPMAVVVSEETVPLYHFLTEVCAIIGGLFTVFSMFTGIIDSTMKSLQKNNLGKLG